MSQAIRSLASGRVVLMLLLLGAYTGWSLASVGWSADLTLTTRRWVQFVLLEIGSVGLGLGYYGSLSDNGRTLARHMVIGSTIAVGAAMLVIVQSGSLNILDPEWSGKALGVSTRMAYPIGFGLLALTWLWAHREMRSWVVGLLFSLLMLALLATKSRLLLLYVAVLVPAYSCTEPRWSARRAMLLVLAGAAVLWALGLWIALSGSDSVQQLAWTYGTLDPTGAGTASDSLNGRTPLWEQMILYASQRPWLGYGFGAFWTPDQLQAVWRVLTWKPPIGHNGFLDEILGTGLVGLALFLLAWMTAIRMSIELKSSRGSEVGGLAAVWLVMFLFMNAGDSIMQTYFQFPFFASLTAVFAVLGSHVCAASRAAPARAHWSYRTS